MKKFLLGFLCGISILNVTLTIANKLTYIAEHANFPVLVDGDEIKLNLPIVTIEGRTYLPLRSMGDILDVKVEWNEEKQQAEIFKRNKPLDVLSVDNEAFDNKIYNFFFSTAKIQMESRIDATLIDMFWTTKIDGKTTFEILKENAYNEMMNVIITAKMAEKSGLIYDDSIARLATSFKQNILERYLSEQNFYDMTGTDEQTLAKVVELMAIKKLYLQQLVQEGQIAATEDDMKRIFESEYMKVKLISFMIVNPKTNVLLEKKVIDEKKILAEQVLNQIKNGGDFDTLMNEYYEDLGFADNPDGYIFTTGQMIIEFEEATKALALGQVSDLVVTQFGYHIIKRIPLTAETNQEEFIREKNNILDSIFTDYLEIKVPQWKVNFNIMETKKYLNEIMLPR